MKIYTHTFDLAQPTPKAFSVAQYSDFGIGIKIVSNGVEVEDAITLKKDGETLTPESEKVAGYTVYVQTADGAAEYTVTCSGQTFRLTMSISDSTVIDVKSGGGGIVGSGFLDFSQLSAVPCASVGMYFMDNAADYKIIVADELYNDWTSNPFWGSLSAHMISASEYLVIMTPYGGQDNMDN